MTREHFVHLGYSVGDASAVTLPIRHMVVTGQTQESGKTTTLEALIARADAGRRQGEPKVRAVAFITKRGERAFQGGTQLQPYFTTRKADWQYVSSLIDTTMGEKNKLLRSFLMKTCRDTATLADVLVNVRAAKATAKGFPESIYTEIEGYLELVVPQLAQLPPAHKLTLKAGLNVMDVSPYSTELQALVLRAVLDQVQDTEEHVIVVVPEAWEFLPENRGSPVKAAAERLVRKGAALGNYLWIDSQDLGGVWKTVVRACPVALIGVQREANEIKRTLANIHTAVKPKPADVAGLELGEFFACWGKHAIKTYVQPAGMAHPSAMAIARGDQDRFVWRPAPDKPKRNPLAGAHIREEILDRPGGRIVEYDEPMEPVGSIVDRMTKAVEELPPAKLPVFKQRPGSPTLEEFVGRGRAAQQAVDAITEHHRVYGPGLTFGELAIGERFYNAVPVVQLPGAHWPPPRGPLLRKTSATGYEWVNGRGMGKNADYYRVERVTVAGTEGAVYEEVVHLPAHHTPKGGEEFMSDAAEKKLDALTGSVTTLSAKVSALIDHMTTRGPLVAPTDLRRVDTSVGPVGEIVQKLEAAGDRELASFADQVADLVIDRMIAMAASGEPGRLAGVLAILTQQPELVVTVQKHTITADDSSMMGRIGLLIADGFFDQGATGYAAWVEAGKRGWSHDRRTVERAVADLATKGFLRKEEDGFRVVGNMKRQVVTA